MLAALNFQVMRKYWRCSTFYIARIDLQVMSEEENEEQFEDEEVEEAREQARRRGRRIY